MSLFLLAGLGCASTLHLVDPSPRQLDDLAAEYESRLSGALANELPLRSDGYAYAVDLANIMSAAVARGNRTLFERAYGIVRQHFLRTDVEVPSARYTARRRYRPGEPAGTSSAQATGRLAAALWSAYEAWGAPEHGRTARAVLEAYLRHGSWAEQGQYRIEARYDYEERSLSGVTRLRSQLPGEVLALACALGDSAMLARARGMARFTRGAYLDRGLSRGMYEPDLAAEVTGADGYFAPNGVLRLETSLQGARTLLPFTETPAREAVGLLDDDYPDVYSHYFHDPRSGRIRPLDGTPADRYTLGERARFLALATAYRDSLGEKFLSDYVGWELIPELEERRGGVSEGFYREIPLVLRAAELYLDRTEPLVSLTSEQCVVAGPPPAAAAPRAGAAAPAQLPNPDTALVPLDRRAELPFPRPAPLPPLAEVPQTAPNPEREQAGPPAEPRPDTATAPAERLPSRGGRWSIVVASFTSPEQAAGALRRYRKAVTAEDVPVGIVVGRAGGRTRYRVAVGQYGSLSELRSAMAEMAPLLPDGAWPLRRGQ